MATMTDTRQLQSPQTALPDARTVSTLDPSHIRIVEIDGPGASLRRDCYDPRGGLLKGDLNGIEDLFQTVNGTLHVCTIDWARTSSLNPSVELEWVSTGMPPKDIDQIRIYNWPTGKLLRVFKHSA